MASNLSMIKHYYSLVKPGIIYGNLIPTLAGFLLASRYHIHVPLLLATLLGTSLIIGSACVFNNYIDRYIDRKMERTRKRVLAQGIIPTSHALIYGTILGFFGVLCLYLYTNVLTMFVGLFGFFVYVVLYSIAKRQSTLGTIVGSISGAMPPVAGYCAVTNHIDLAALLLFLLLVLWQMPHFYAIAMYRMEDYKAANIPVMPLIHGFRTTKIHILLYIIAFFITTICLALFHYTGNIYAIGVILLGLFWLGLSYRGFGLSDHTTWAKKMFFTSLLVLISVCILMSIDIR